MSCLDVIWFIIVSCAFLFYLMMLFSITKDLFADHETSGTMKALWVILLLIFPLLTALVYLLVRGDGMARRSRVAAEHFRQQRDAFIRSVAAQDIAAAKQLLDAGTITAQEFDILKTKALS